MSDLLRLSVVVASHGRPDLLCRCLVGLSQQDLPQFEIIVVADSAGLDAIKTLPFAGRIKIAKQSEPNISKARNQGIALAGGEVVAFIDDDAVPEQNWADRLLARFADAQVAAVTGRVLGRNGISEQWGEMSFDHLGRDYRGAERAKGPYLKLHGTNLAIRRNLLCDLGGFDEALRFYLDETDLAIRLQKQSLNCMFDTNIVVHHGFAQSARRQENRVPKTLFEIGASLAVFLRKHAPSAAMEPRLSEFKKEQEVRLSRFEKAGQLSGSRHGQLMDDLEAGIADGQTRDLAQYPAFAEAEAFRPFRAEGEIVGETRVLSGLWRHRHELRKKAAEMAAQGLRPTVILLQLTPLAHHLTFETLGYWEQRGGQFGRSDRQKRRVQFWSFRSRVKAEIERIRKFRPNL